MKYFILIIVISLAILSSCKKKTNNSQEVTTTIKLQLTKSGNTFTYVWNDVDGPGGSNPTIDTIFLDSASIYDGKIQVLDQSKSPIDDITQEIKTESDVHQFFFEPTGLNTTKVFATDQDVNSLPIGLTFKTETGTKSIGTLRVFLSHYDGIKKTTAPSPETDIDVTFPVVIH